jgi:hypothetical protein
MALIWSHTSKVEKYSITLSCLYWWQNDHMSKVEKYSITLSCLYWWQNAVRGLEIMNNAISYQITYCPTHNVVLSTPYHEWDSNSQL